MTTVILEGGRTADLDLASYEPGTTIGTIATGLLGDAAVGTFTLKVDGDVHEPSTPLEQVALADARTVEVVDVTDYIGAWVGAARDVGEAIEVPLGETGELVVDDDHDED